MATAKNVKPGEEFVFCNGASAATVEQCREELQRLTPDQFHYHVNPEKNDIFNWIRDCVDAKLAQRLRGLLDRDQIVVALSSPAAPKAQAGAPRASRSAPPKRKKV